LTVASVKTVSVGREVGVVVVTAAVEDVVIKSEFQSLHRADCSLL